MAGTLGGGAEFFVGLVEMTLPPSSDAALGAFVLAVGLAFLDLALATFALFAALAASAAWVFFRGLGGHGGELPLPVLLDFHKRRHC